MCVCPFKAPKSWFMSFISVPVSLLSLSGARAPRLTSALLLSSQCKAPTSSRLIWAAFCQRDTKCWEINAQGRSRWQDSFEVETGQLASELWLQIWKGSAEASERSHSWCQLQIGARQCYKGPAKLSTVGKTQAPREKGRPPRAWSSDAQSSKLLFWD